MRTLSAFLLALAFSMHPLAAQVPVGREVTVNQTLADRQTVPDVGVASDGSFVVVWNDEQQGRIRARLYRADGKPRGGEIRVSRLGERQQAAPALAARPDGSFVVVWNRVWGGDRPNEVYASRFGAGGRPLGSPLLVGFAGRASALDPATVVLLPDGGFVVAWSLEDGGTAGNIPSRDVYGRRFTRDGVPVGEPVALNEDPAGDQSTPDCALSPGDRISCAWRNDVGGGGHFSEIVFRRFDLDGLQGGTELRVNDPQPTGWLQLHPSVAVNRDGEVLVVWEDIGAVHDLLGRIVEDFDDAFLSPTFRLTTREPGPARRPRAAGVTADGGVAIVWWSGNQILLRRMSPGWAFLGSEVVVNQRRRSFVADPAVAVGPGRGAVVWAFPVQDFQDMDVAARRLR